MTDQAPFNAAGEFVTSIRVRDGDTLETVAARLNVSPDFLFDMNRGIIGSDRANVRFGMLLEIPTTDPQGPWPTPATHPQGPFPTPATNPQGPFRTATNPQGPFPTPATPITTTTTTTIEEARAAARARSVK